MKLLYIPHILFSGQLRETIIFCANSFHHYSNEFSITACTRKNVTSVANLKYPRVDTQQKRSVARNCRDQISATHASISPPVYTKKYSRAGKVAGLYFISFFFPSGTQNVGNQCGIFFFGERRLAPKKTTLYVWEKKGEKIQAEIFVGCFTVFFAGAILHFSAAAGKPE